MSSILSISYHQALNVVTSVIKCLFTSTKLLFLANSGRYDFDLMRFDSSSARQACSKGESCLLHNAVFGECLSDNTSLQHLSVQLLNLTAKRPHKNHTTLFHIPPFFTPIGFFWAFCFLTPWGSLTFVFIFPWGMMICSLDLRSERIVRCRFEM